MWTNSAATVRHFSVFWKYLIIMWRNCVQYHVCGVMDGSVIDGVETGRAQNHWQELCSILVRKQPELSTWACGCLPPCLYLEMHPYASYRFMYIKIYSINMCSNVRHVKYVISTCALIYSVCTPILCVLNMWYICTYAQILYGCISEHMFVHKEVSWKTAAMLMFYLFLLFPFLLHKRSLCCAGNAGLPKWIHHVYHAAPPYTLPPPFFAVRHQPSMCASVSPCTSSASGTSIR